QFFLDHADEDVVELRQPGNRGVNGLDQATRGIGAVHGDRVPALVVVGAPAHQVVLLPVAAVDVGPAADPTGDVLPRPDGPLLGDVLAGVDAVGGLPAVLGVALVEHADQPVIYRSGSMKARWETDRSRRSPGGAGTDLRRPLSLTRLAILRFRTRMPFK